MPADGNLQFGVSLIRETTDAFWLQGAFGC
jgi:hypothetical protein